MTNAPSRPEWPPAPYGTTWIVTLARGIWARYSDWLSMQRGGGHAEIMTGRAGRPRW
jgi:hypothetical protein